MAEDKTPKKKTSATNSDKVFDIAHPSKAKIDSTSRPVIVGHKNTMQKDPMVSPTSSKALEVSEDTEPGKQNDSEAQKPTEEEILERPKRELKIAVPEEETTSEAEENIDSTEEESAPEKVDTVEASGVVSEKATENPEEPETSNDGDETDEKAEESADEETQEQPIADEEIAQPTESVTESSTGEGSINAVVETVSTKKEKAEAVDQQTKADEAIKGMINSKKYNVKINAPAKTKKLRWLLVLLVFVALAMAAWYLTNGPGKDLWINNQPASTASDVTPPVTQNQQAVEQGSDEPELRTFEDSELGLSFAYPSDWEIKTTEGEETPLEILPPGPYTAITINAPVEDVLTADIGNVKGVEAEVFLQTKIFIEKDVPSDRVANFKVKFSSCTTEDIILGNKNLALAFIDETEPAPNIETATVSSADCSAAEDGFFDIPVQFQLSTDKNMYVIKSKLIYSEQYLRQNGSTETEDIEAAQEEGVLVSIESFKGSDNYNSFLEILKSIKEL